MKSIILNALITLFVGSAQAADFTYDTVVKKLAFGSGQNQRKDDSHWKAVNTELPNIWVWLGEITQTTFAGPKAKKKAYDKVLSSLGYQEVRSRSQILGVWDEEDIKPNMNRTREPFLGFLNEPFESPRYKRDALYASYLIGPKDKRIKLILLDTYMQREKSSSILLGSAQWAWLEQELSADTIEKENAQVVIIGTPLTFLGNGPRKRSWSDYKTEQQKLLDLAGKLKISTFVISGHNHIGEFSSIELASGQKLNEIASSGLNMPGGKVRSNEHRVGSAITARNFGILEFTWPTNGSTETVKVSPRIQSL